MFVAPDMSYTDNMQYNSKIFKEFAYDWNCSLKFSRLHC